MGSHKHCQNPACFCVDTVPAKNERRVKVGDKVERLTARNAELVKLLREKSASFPSRSPLTEWENRVLVLLARIDAETATVLMADGAAELPSASTASGRVAFGAGECAAGDVGTYPDCKAHPMPSEPPAISDHERPVVCTCCKIHEHKGTLVQAEAKGRRELAKHLLGWHVVTGQLRSFLEDEAGK